MFEIDFRQHKELIRKAIADNQFRDKNWRWSVKSVSKHKALIKWTYLDYCEEQYPKNCFVIECEFPKDESLWNGIKTSTPHGEMIEYRTFGDKNWDTDDTLEQSIERSVRDIICYALSRY